MLYQKQTQTLRQKRTPAVLRQARLEDGPVVVAAR